MNPVCDFKGQVALITGAAKGMGLATARVFAENGASVVLAASMATFAEHEAQRIVGDGGTAISTACDVAWHSYPSFTRTPKHQAYVQITAARMTADGIINVRP